VFSAIWSHRFQPELMVDSGAHFGTSSSATTLEDSRLVSTVGRTFPGIGIHEISKLHISENAVNLNSLVTKDF
ncbi:hypothetical protein V4Y02_24030, partial [Escherichia coli]